jgi:hypothetical protein
MTFKKENYKIILPDSAFLIIEEIIKKNKLGPTNFFDPEIAEKINQCETLKEKRQAADSFPVVQIPKIVKRAAQCKISHEVLASEIQKTLNISLEKATGIAQDIRNRVLGLVQKIPIIENEKGFTTTIKPPPKEFAERAKRIKKISEIAEIKKQRPKKTGKDTYREPVE